MDNVYGYLRYCAPKSNVLFPIRKQNITIGSQATNTIRLRNQGPVNRQLLKLSVEQSSSTNGYIYTLDICCFLKIVRDNITVNDANVFADKKSIELYHNDVINIFGKQFTLLTNIKSKTPSNIPQSIPKITSLMKKYPLIDLYSPAKSWSKKNLTTLNNGSASKIPVLQTTKKLIDFNSPIIKSEEKNQINENTSHDDNGNGNNSNDNNDEIVNGNDNKDVPAKLNETFEIDTSQSKSIKSNTPSPSINRLKIDAKVLKSSLKKSATPQQIPRKSVAFKEFVEENHIENNGNIGLMFSIKKLSTNETSDCAEDSFVQNENLCQSIVEQEQQQTIYEDANTEISVMDPKFVTAIETIDQNAESDDCDESTIIKENEKSSTVVDINGDKDQEMPEDSHQIKQLSPPATPAADYESNVDYAIKKLQQPQTPVADYQSNVDYGIKKLQQPATPVADYESNVDYAIKKLQQPQTPVADYQSNVDFGIKKLEQPQTPVADYESKVDFAIKKLQQPGTPVANYESNVDYAIKKLQQPQTPVADYDTNVDYGIKKLQQPTTPTADYQTNIDYAIKKLQQPRTPDADYVANADYAIKKLQQPVTPPADYESNIDFGIKKLVKSVTPQPDYDLNLSGLENLFENDLLDTNIMITPIKSKRGRRPRQIQKVDSSDYQILTRSARKNRAKNNGNEEETMEQAQSTRQAENKRRRKNDKDEIALLLDSDDDSVKSELDVGKILETAKTKSSQDANRNQVERGRSRKKTVHQQSEAADLIDLDDNQLLEVMEEKPAKKTRAKNGTGGRKRRTNVNESTTKPKTKSNDSRKTKTNHKVNEIDNDNDHDELKENRKQLANRQPVGNESKKIRILLPDEDVSLNIDDSSETKSMTKRYRSRRNC